METLCQSLRNGLLIVPIFEYITGYIVGIDILRIFQPFMMEDF